jgi:short subunit fatty acids transporter
MKFDAKVVVGVLVVLVVGFLLFKYMTTPEDRTVGQKVEAAVDNLDNGVDDAARELQDRTPAQRIEDGIEDATDGNAN